MANSRARVGARDVISELICDVAIEEQLRVVADVDGRGDAVRDGRRRERQRVHHWPGHTVAQHVASALKVERHWSRLGGGLGGVGVGGVEQRRTARGGACEHLRRRSRWQCWWRRRARRWRRRVLPGDYYIAVAVHGDERGTIMQTGAHSSASARIIVCAAIRIGCTNWNAASPGLAQQRESVFHFAADNSTARANAVSIN